MFLDPFWDPFSQQLLLRLLLLLLLLLRGGEGNRGDRDVCLVHRRMQVVQAYKITMPLPLPSKCPKPKLTRLQDSQDYW